jgi:MoxR-like ATPase
MVKLTVGYLSVEEETDILRRRRERMQDDVQLNMVTNARQLLELRQAVESVFVDTDLETYIARLVHETRIDRRVAVGGSPRASLAFLKLARARAALENREFILPDDIKHFAQPVLSHRLILQPEYWMARRVAEEVIRDVMEKVPVPVVRRT